jgi:hypothetical protein
MSIRCHPNTIGNFSKCICVSCNFVHSNQQMTSTISNTIVPRSVRHNLISFGFVESSKKMPTNQAKKII